MSIPLYTFICMCIECFRFFPSINPSIRHDPSFTPPPAVCCIAVWSTITHFSFPCFLFAPFPFFFLFFLFGYSKSHSFCPYFIRASTNPDRVSVATNTLGATGNQSPFSPSCLESLPRFETGHYRAQRTWGSESAQL